MKAFTDLIVNNLKHYLQERIKGYITVHYLERYDTIKVTIQHDSLNGDVFTYIIYDVTKQFIHGFELEEIYTDIHAKFKHKILNKIFRNNG